MIYEPSATDITDGLADDALADLTEVQRATVVLLMARAAERSYRRGFQQGVVVEALRSNEVRAELHDWRYGPSTDLSPWADGPRVEPSWHRLFMENPQLHRLGFEEPEHELQDTLKFDPTYRSRGTSVQ